jgi:DHA2 family methylenomycin A resistance protein-like MFS transporter
MIDNVERRLPLKKELQLRTDAPGKSAKALLLFGVSLGYFMVLLDTTVVNIALPAIHDDLGGGIAGLQWVINAYTIVFAGLLMSMGALADKVGAKRVFSIGLVIFLAASALSAAAPSLGLLIGLRALLGIGGAALMPASLSILAHVYPDPAERARVIGIWAATTGTAMAAGPVVGGLLVDAFGWRSIFLINVPLSILSLILILPLLSETPRKPGQGFDWPGQVTAIAAIATLSFALMEGETYGWGSPVIATAFGLALASAVLFLVAERKGGAPMFPLHMFGNRTVSSGLAAGMAINIGLSGILFVMPLYYQQVRGMSAHSAGLALLPLTIPLVVNPIFTGRLAGKIGPRLPMTFGFILAAIGALIQVRVNTETSHAITWAGLLLFGCGVTFTIPPLMAAVVSAVSRELTGTASGALNSARQLGATLGVAVVGSMLAGSGAFMDGMHRSMIVVSSVLLFGGLVTYTFIGRSKS